MKLSMYVLISCLVLVIQCDGHGDPHSFRMPQYAELEPPAARSADLVKGLLQGQDTTPRDDRVFRLLLVAGPKDHQVGEHDYPAWQKVWSRLLAKAPKTEVTTAWEFPTPDVAADADVIIFYQKGNWNNARAALIDQHQMRGGGLVYIHWAVNGADRAHQFAERIGLASKAGAICYRHGPLKIDFSQAGNHPVARNFTEIDWYDESYWRLRGDRSRIDLLGTSREEDSARPQFWTTKYKAGRVFVSIPGHYMWTFDDPAFRLLLMRGIAWAGKRNVDRFDELIWLDARYGE